LPAVLMQAEAAWKNSESFEERSMSRREPEEVGQPLLDRAMISDERAHLAQ
jgi:hypothetical protein